jgi:hypothetical protein
MMSDEVELATPPSAFDNCLTIYPAKKRRFRLPESRLQAESKKRETPKTLNLQ